MREQKVKISIIFGWLFLPVFILGYGRADAHSLPNSKAQLIVNGQSVLIRFKTPVEIVELASKKQINWQSSYSLDSLRQYYLRHISVTDTLHSHWKITVDKIFTQVMKDRIVGEYREISTDIYLVPDNPASLRNFTLYCDLVIHQIPNQSILFAVEQDWPSGIIKNDTRQIGIISVDTRTGKIFPLKIQLGEGNWFKGFKNMVALGMQHIREGTDHLLFLIVLLLPAMLQVNGKKWGESGGIKYSLARLLKIVTAFTIGHSVTLLIGALGWIRLPTQPIEIMIAVSILVSAIHAVYPVFPGKETYVASGFGLIHGLAFATILSNLQLDMGTLILSIFGFNLGIELMQLFIIAIITPWLILLSRRTFYKWFRVTGALVAAMIAIVWIIERGAGK